MLKITKNVISEIYNFVRNFMFLPTVETSLNQDFKDMYVKNFYLVYDYIK
jgi:hypothetical protein